MEAGGFSVKTYSANYDYPIKTPSEEQCCLQKVVVGPLLKKILKNY